MTSETAEAITVYALLAPWLVLYLPLEIYFILRRKYRDPNEKLVKLVSQVAKERGWQLNCLVYVWSGMASHWWWNADWGNALAGITFWVILALLCVFDAFCWHIPVSKYPTWMRWARWPFLWMAAGLAAGRLLFPQNGFYPWSGS